MNPHPPSRFPTFHRLGAATARAVSASLRWLRRALRPFFCRTALVIYGVAFTVVCLFYSTYRWYGRRAWAEEKARVEATGGSFDIETLAGPMPADEDNFFATPTLKQALTGSEEALDALLLWDVPKRTLTTIRPSGKPFYSKVEPPADGSLAGWCRVFHELGTLPDNTDSLSPAEELLADHRHDAVIHELRTAAARPESVMPRSAGITILDRFDIESWRVSARIAGSVELHARACLVTGDLDGTLADARVIFRTRQGYAASGNLVTLPNIRSETTARILKEGRAAQQWTDAALARLLTDDLRPAFRKGLTKALAVERGRGCYEFLHYRELILPRRGPWGGAALMRPWVRRIGPWYPDGWWMQQCVLYSQRMTNLAEAAGSAISLAGLAEMERRLPGARFWPATPPDNEDWNFVSFALRGALSLEVERLAIHLERHWLKHGRYPDALANLDPAPADGLPTGTDGQPFRYRASADGSTMRVWWDGAPPGTDFAGSAITYSNE